MSALEEYWTNEMLLNDAFKKVTAGKEDKNLYEMATWIKSYWEDAGWRDWSYRSSLFKARIMAAFPPLEHLDGAGDDLSDLDLTEFEVRMLKMLEAFNSSVAAEKKSKAFEGEKAYSHTGMHFMRTR